MSPRAVIYSPRPDSELGGVERFCALVRDLLEEDGWDVSVVGPEGEMPLWTYRLGGGPLWQAARSTSAAARAGDGAPPDLVVSNGFLGGRPPAGVPRIQVFHQTSVAHALRGGAGWPARERVRRIAGGGAAEALACRGATVVTVSQSVAEEVRRYYRSNVDRVIPNGVDTERFSPRDRSEARRRLDLDPGERYALYAGRIEGLKGWSVLGPACARAGYELLVTGTATPAAGRGLGFLSLVELADAYAAADCVLLPTRYEGCSYVVLEALASGTPLLTTRVGWMHTFLDAVPEYGSLLVTPDVAGIAARLRTLEELELDALTAKGRSYVEEHNDLERFRRDWREAIAGATGGRRPVYPQ